MSAEANTYRRSDSGWLEREVYRAPRDSKVSVAYVDVLVGAGRMAQVREMPAAALLDVKAGTALVSTGKEQQQRSAPGMVLRANQGEMLLIDNSKGERSFVARLMLIALPR